VSASNGEPSFLNVVLRSWINAVLRSSRDFGWLGDGFGVAAALASIIESTQIPFSRGR